MDKRKIGRNVFSSLSVTIFSAFLTFLNRKVFIYILGIQYLGLNALFVDILGVLSLADLGLGTAMMYSLYRPIAENDNKKIRDLVSFFRKVYTNIATCIFLLGLFVIPFLPYIVRLDTEIRYMELYYVLLLMNTAISYLFVYRAVLIQANQKQYIVNNINMCFKLILFCVQIFVLALTESYGAYIIFNLLISLLNNFVLNKKSIELYPFLKEKATELSLEEKKEIKINVQSMFYYKFAATVINNTDNVLISYFVGTVTVGLYSNYILCINLLVVFFGILSQQLKASVGLRLADERPSSHENFLLFKRIDFMNYWLVFLCSIAIYVLFDDFIGILFGQDLLSGEGIVFLIGLNFYTANVRQSVWVFRETTEVFKETKYVTVQTALLNLVFSLIFGAFYGLGGILIATTFSRILVSLKKETDILYKSVFEVNPGLYYVEYWKRIAITLICGYITNVIANIAVFSSVCAVFVYKVAILCIVPNFLFLLFTYKTEEFLYVKAKLKALYKFMIKTLTKRKSP